MIEEAGKTGMENVTMMGVDTLFEAGMNHATMIEDTVPTEIIGKRGRENIFIAPVAMIVAEARVREVRGVGNGADQGVRKVAETQDENMKIVGQST